MRILHRFTPLTHSPFPSNPFTAHIQIRFKKPANTAQTRIETRTRDLKLDHLAFHHRRLALVLSIHSLVSGKKRGPYVSVQILSKWAPHAGLNTLTAGELLRKYPHVFEVFTHPVKKIACCKFRPKFVELVVREEEIVFGMEEVNVMRLKRVLSMSVNGRVHIHAIRLMRRELGLPENFRDQIIGKYVEIFRMVDLEIVELVDSDESKRDLAFSAEVENWREKEFTDKWLSEFETKYSFPINFPTGYKILRGNREKLRNWQRLSYVKPYERMEKIRVRTCGGVERYEKRAVGIIHELLCLTVEKKVEVERLAHFKKDLGIEVNIREVLLRHPGIFYVSTRGNSQVVFLREACDRDRLVDPNPVYDLRRELLELLTLGCRNTGQLREVKEVEEDRKEETSDENNGGAREGDFVIPLLESFCEESRL